MKQRANPTRRDGGIESRNNPLTEEFAVDVSFAKLEYGGNDAITAKLIEEG